MTMRALLAALILALPLSEGRAQPAARQALVVRSSAEPQTAMVGQRVAFYVDVLFRDDMPAPPRVAAPEIPGAQVFRFESQGLTMREQIDGANYVGQRFEFAIYARRAGQFSIPPAAISVLDRSGDQTASAMSEPVSFRAVLPAGFDASQPIIASTNVTMTEEWSPAPASGFKVGSAIKRTVRRQAQDVPGLAMQPPDQTAPQGVRVYADAPDIDDSANRGAVTGRRTDRLTYVFEVAGDFTLPAITQIWWDLASAAARTASTAPAQIHVAALESQPTEAARGQRSWSANQWLAIGALALALAAILAFARRIGPRIAATVRAWMNKRRASEKHAFRQAERACRTSDPWETYRALQAWRSKCPAREATTTSHAGERSSADAVAILERTLFGISPGAASWTPERGKQLAAQLRDERRRMAPKRASRSRHALPPLNPDGVQRDRAE